MIWVVRGTVVRVVDGDTLGLDLDLGWRTWIRNEPVRLARINAPELRTPEGQASKQYLETLTPVGAIVRVESVGKYGREKYGRVLANIHLLDPFSACINDIMLKSGHATPYPS